MSSKDMYISSIPVPHSTIPVVSQLNTLGDSYSNYCTKMPLEKKSLTTFEKLVPTTSDKLIKPTAHKLSHSTGLRHTRETAHTCRSILSTSPRMRSMSAPRFNHINPPHTHHSPLHSPTSIPKYSFTPAPQYTRTYSPMHSPRYSPTHAPKYWYSPKSVLEYNPRSSPRYSPITEPQLTPVNAFRLSQESAFKVNPKSALTDVCLHVPSLLTSNNNNPNVGLDVLKENNALRASPIDIILERSAETLRNQRKDTQSSSERLPLLDCNSDLQFNHSSYSAHKDSLGSKVEHQINPINNKFEESNLLECPKNVLNELNKSQVHCDFAENPITEQDHAKLKNQNPKKDKNDLGAYTLSGQTIKTPFSSSVISAAELHSEIQTAYLALLGHSFLAKFESHIYEDEADAVKTELSITDDLTTCTILRFIKHKLAYLQEEKKLCFDDIPVTSPFHIWSGFHLSSNFDSAQIFIEPLSSVGTKDFDVPNIFIVLDVDVKIRRHHHQTHTHHHHHHQAGESVEGGTAPFSCMCIVNLWGTVDTNFYN